MPQLVYAHEVKVSGDDVSSNYIIVLQRGKAPLSKWQQGQIRDMIVA